MSSLPVVSGNDNSDEFHDVELAAANSGGPVFFVEKADINNLMSTIGVLFLFIAVHIFAAWRAPGIISFDKQYYALNQTDPNTSIDIDVTLTTLQEQHRFVHVNGSLVRNVSLDSELSLPVEITSRLIYSRNNSIINSENVDKANLKIDFLRGKDTSSTFPVVHKDIVKYDTLQVKMTMTADLSSISGFRFTWSFGNPSGIKYSHSARLLMSCLVGYMFIIFINAHTFNSEFFTQVFVIVIGIAGIFSSNPFSIIFPVSRICKIADQILLAAFVAIFRMFILCQFEMIRTKSTSPNIFVSIIFALYLGLHATIDASAGYDRVSFATSSISPVNVVLPTETYLMYADAVYIVISLIWLILAFVQSDNYGSRRLYYYSMITALITGATLFSQVYCVVTGALMFTIMPSMIYISVHMTTTAFSIFMMHHGGGPKYTQMGGEKDAGVLDVEQMTDDEIDDDIDDEEEEAEEEEEEEE